MRRVKEVLRLRFELGLGQRQIARCCGMGLGTVHEYLERALAAGIGWPLPEGLGEEELEGKLFGNQPVLAGAVRQRPEPDWVAHLNLGGRGRFCCPISAKSAVEVDRMDRGASSPK